jgi:uncharacterized membrane protein YphA (DoxX/SURF4 family)
MNGSSPASQSPEKVADGERPDATPGAAPAIPNLNKPAFRTRSWFRLAIDFVLFSRWTERVCRYLLAGVFLLAAVSKIIDLSGFIDHLALHSPLSVPVARVVGAFLPWLELSCAFCMLLNVLCRESAVILAVLLTLFIGYDFWVPADANCGCFLFPGQVIESSVVYRSLPRNLFLLACAFRIIFDDVVRAGQMTSGSKARPIG